MFKQVMIVIQSLKLPKGKLAAQVAHASVDATLKADKSVLSTWRSEGMAKIVVKVESERDLYRILQQAKDEGLPTSLITDAGKTVVAPGTVTCGAIGPAEEEKVNQYTKDLKLL